MKKFVMLLFSACLIISCDSSIKKTNLEPPAFEAAISGGKVQLLDMRGTNEYQAGHIKNALQADWNNQVEFREYAAHLVKDKPLLVYSETSTRSAPGSDWLAGQGYKVTELQGGFEKWKTAGMPVTTAENEKPVSFAEYKVLTNLGPVVLVDIGADWCPPCRKMEPVIEQLEKDFGDNFKLVKIDAGMQTELMKQVNAEKIPTFIIYKNGGETWRKEGIVDIIELKRKLK
jgi:thiol-disulfide isomerase/thioredoxin